MRTDEFNDYIQKGLGRAILLLRAETDKTPFREIALSFLLVDDIFERSTDYQLDLIESFDDSETFKKEIISKICRSIEKGDFCPNNKLLLALGAGDKYKQSYLIRYNVFFEKTISNLKNNAASREFEIDRSRLYDARLHLVQCLELNEIKKILEDQISQIKLEDKESKVCYDSSFRFFNAIKQRFGAADAHNLLSEISSHPDGHILKKHFENVNSYFQKYFEMPIIDPTHITAEELCEDPKKEYYEDYEKEAYMKKIAFSMSSDETVRKVAETLISETDLQKRCWILSLFSNICLSYKEKLHQLPYFPLDVEKILPLIDDLDYQKIKNGDSLAVKYQRALMSAISRLQHPRIKALGYKLLQNDDLFLFSNGLSILFKNYSKEDYDTVVSLLTKSCDNARDVNRLSYILSSLCTAAEGGTSDLPVNALPSLWPLILTANFRERVLKIILNNNILTDELREECRYDSSTIIRTMIKESDNEGCRI